jgi:hypothetical protein
MASSGRPRHGTTSRGAPDGFAGERGNAINTSVKDIIEADPSRQPLDVGVHPNVVDTAYHKMFALSNSGSGVLLDHTPRHFVDWQLNDDETKTSDAKQRGTAVHAAMFTPEIYKSRYAIGPDVARNRREWKDWASQYEHEPDRILIKESLGRQILSMRDAIMQHSRAGRLIQRATDFEATGIVVEPDSGALCKMRGDIIGPGYLADLKTCRDVSDKGIADAISNYNYHRQVATYWHLAALLGMSIDHFFLIFIETGLTPAVRVVEVDQDDLVAGWDDFRRAAEIYQRCVESNDWPAYDERIVVIRRPEYIRRRERYERDTDEQE